jgi:hypothetical protein
MGRLRAAAILTAVTWMFPAALGGHTNWAPSG